MDNAAIAALVKKEMTAAKKSSDGAFDNVDVSIVKAGKKIILPNDPREMTTDEAIVQLQRLNKQEQTEVAIAEEVPSAWPLEGAYAMMQVLKHRYGWANAVPTPGFFGPRPPVMLSLEVDVNVNVQVIWGEFEIPGVEGRLATAYTIKDNRPIFMLSGKVKKKYEKEIKEIADQVRAYCSEFSLYKGKAVKLITNKTNDGKFAIDFMNPPRFMDLSRINEEELTFSEQVRAEVQTHLFTPVEKTKLCRQLKVPLKRTILLAGPYGTGKTLTASVTAKKATENGWTYIYLDRVESLKEAMIFARQYAPAVLFAEDVESVVTADRTTEVNDILNNIDGIDSKGQEVVCIFTTNHIDRIGPAMLRPGRLDAIIQVDPPDAAAARKLIRIYSQGLVTVDTDLTKSGEVLAGKIPAVIREVVERAKLFALNRAVNDQAPTSLTDEDIMYSAVSMNKHLDLMNPKAKDELSSEAKLGRAMSTVLVEALAQHPNVVAIEANTKDILERL